MGKSKVGEPSILPGVAGSVSRIDEVVCQGSWPEPIIHPASQEVLQQGTQQVVLCSAMLGGERVDGWQGLVAVVVVVAGSW